MQQQLQLDGIVYSSKID